MPIFTINTNVKNIPESFHREALDVIGKTLGKPASYIAIQLNQGQDISFGGTNEPAALCELTSIGALSTVVNKKVSKAIMDLPSLSTIRSERIYITFKNVNKADIGFNKTTFDDLL